MIDYLRTQEKSKLRKMMLVHGDKNALSGFKDHLEEAGYQNVFIPRLGDTVDL